MRPETLAVLAAAAFCAGSVHAQAGPAPELARQVFVAESSFAATMARRDLKAFGEFVAPDAVFFGRTVMRGNAEVVEGWRALFEAADAPFSWRPETVEVLPSGDLALTSGPVFGKDGKQTGTFTSIWRREPDGKWRVLFDKGCSIGQ